MDLGAYINISSLRPLLEANGIKDIKRLRGLRLMQSEIPVEYTEKDINKFAKYDVENLIRTVPGNLIEFSTHTDIKVDYYLYPNKSPRWNRIHGKLRKAVKFCIKKAKKAYINQMDMFNKYCGRDDVLYIHARLGAGNWNYYNCSEYLKQSWYLDHIEDAFDCTYCDIYAKIDPNITKDLLDKIKDEDGE